MLSSSGTGGWMRNATGAPWVPPGLVMARLASPAEATSSAGTWAVTPPDSTNSVSNGWPFHATTAPGRNPLPLIANVVAPAP
ncbi:MAG: hypothetical protein QM757_46865 [Paludibaculum sp.]